MNVVVPQLNHFIHGNMYYRESTVPAGALVVGCTHKKDAIAFLISGSIKQIDGDNHYIVDAPAIIKTIAGTQRYAYAITKTTYATVTKCDTTDIDNVEIEMYEEKTINKEISDQYNSMMIGYGIDDDIVKKDMELVDVIEDDIDGVYIDKSGIEGYGIFLSKNFNAGEKIGSAIKDKKKTILGRYINHSCYPNVFYDRNMNIIARYDLVEGQEIMLDYSIVLDRLLGDEK